MGERLRTTAARHPGRALGVLAAVAVLGAALAAGWTDRLALSSGGSNAAPLRIRARGPLRADSPTFRVAVRTMRAQLSVDPAVAAVREQGRGRGANSTLLLVRFGVGGRSRDAAIARIERNLDPGPLTLAFEGPLAVVQAAKDDALSDLYLLLLALPLAALIAAGVIGVRPTGAALLAAAAAASLASLACELLGGPVEISWLALVGSAAGGTLLALQGCALARSGAGAGAVWAAGVAAAATFAAAAILRVDYLASLGLGGALGSILAVPASLTAMGAASGVEPVAQAGGAARLWGGIGGLVGWSRAAAVLFAVLALALLAIVAIPAQRLQAAALGMLSAPAIDRLELVGAIAAAALVSVALGLAVGRRFGLALSSAIAAAFPALAVAGLLVVTFQEGRLEGPLAYTSTGALQLGSVVGAVTIVAALGAAQAVALASAARVAHGAGVERVREAMARCGPAATLSCCAGIAAGIALGFGSRGFVKELGLGIAAGLALELLIVEALIAPALLRLLAGRAARE